MTKERLFAEEERVVSNFQLLLEDGNSLSAEEYKHQLSVLTNKYQELLDQTRFLTRISDRLENKLHGLNSVLNKKNHELKVTLDELKKARISKRAYAIIYMIAASLFVFEEFVVDPVLSIFGKGMAIALLIKFCIVLLLKPTENLLENNFLGGLIKK